MGGDRRRGRVPAGKPAADLQHPADHVGVLVEGPRVAFQTRARHPGQHGEEIMMVPGRDRQQELRPCVRGGAQDGLGRGVVRWRGPSGDEGEAGLRRAGGDGKAERPVPGPDRQDGIGGTGGVPGGRIGERRHFGSITSSTTGWYSFAMPGLLGRAQALHGQFGAGDGNAGFLRQVQRVGQVLHRVAGGEGAFGEDPGHHRLHAVAAQHEAVAGALGDGGQQQLRGHAVAAAEGDRFRQRRGVLEHQHVVQDLHHLSGADRTAMGDVGAHRLQHRADMGEHGVGRADHDRELAARRRFARARHRCVGEADAACGQPGADRAGERDRGGAGIDHALARLQMGFDLGQHRLHRPPVGQGEQDEIGAAGDLRRRRGGDAGGGEAGERLVPPVVRQHGAAEAPGQVAAHRLPHDAEADEAKGGERAQRLVHAWAAPVVGCHQSANRRAACQSRAGHVSCPLAGGERRPPRGNQPPTAIRRIVALVLWPWRRSTSTTLPPQPVTRSPPTT